MLEGSSAGGHLDGWANLTVLDVVGGASTGGHEVELVGDANERESFLRLQTGEQIHDGVGDFGIQCGGDLVAQEQVRLCSEGTRDRGALTPTAGQLVRIAAGEVAGQPDGFE